MPVVVDEYLRGVRFDGYHVVVQFTHGHVIVAPVQISLAAHGVGENVRVDILSAFHSARKSLPYQRLAAVLERAERMVGYRHAHLLLRRVVKIILVTAVCLFFLDDARCPCVLFRP